MRSDWLKDSVANDKTDPFGMEYLFGRPQSPQLFDYKNRCKNMEFPFWCNDTWYFGYSEKIHSSVFRPRVRIEYLLYLDVIAAEFSSDVIRF